MPPRPTIYSSDMLNTSGSFPARRSSNLSEFTMQSRLISEEEARNRARWFRVNLTGPLKNFPRNICYLTYITTLVIKNNNLERLPPELGNLVNLANLDASYNRLRSLPSTIGELVDLRALILNDNQISDLPVQVASLLNLRSLNLHNNPLSPESVALYGDGTEMYVRRFIRHYLDIYWQQHVGTTPPHRQWRLFGTPTRNGYRLTVMCYNVLSANYATHTQYPYCPSWAIDWEYRRRGILEELRQYSPNLICLQEIDTDQFETVFVPELARNSYEGVFLPKSRSRTMDPASARKVDGCAIFWNTEKFNKVAVFHHEFMLSCSSVAERPSALLLNRIMTRDNVAIGVVLEIKNSGASGRKFCVTTGHIHWDPEHSDVKLIQTILWTAELWSRLEEFNGDDGKPGSRIPVILCGDFNSLPHSGVIEYLSTGSVPANHVEFLNHGFSYHIEDWKLLEKGAYVDDVVHHRFNLDRAYRANANDGMKVTNLTHDFKGMIDYVFFSRNHFRLLGSLDQIPDSWFLEERVVGCPHVHMPSDHFSLLVELDLLAQTGRGLAISDPAEGSAPSASVSAVTPTIASTLAATSTTVNSSGTSATNPTSSTTNSSASATANSTTGTTANTASTTNSPKPKGSSGSRQKQGKRQ